MQYKRCRQNRGMFPGAYKQLSEVEFSRVWVNSVSEWASDNQGNDLKPTQVEAPEWVESQLYDAEGYVVEPLSLYLTAGKHTITVVSQREPMVLGAITLKNEKTPLDYQEQYQQWFGDGGKDTSGQLVEIQAEYAEKKSSSMLYPTQDQSSPAISPYSARALKNNTIGGNSWSHTGQWIEWGFDVEQDGFYNIALHAKQNFVKGIYVSRKILLDGQVPFSEMSHYGFTYNSDWEMIKLSDEAGEPYRFYLTAGHHTLRMHRDSRLRYLSDRPPVRHSRRAERLCPEDLQLCAGRFRHPERPGSAAPV